MEIRTRAPGKIILSGEHAVVHGSTAVAAAIGLYTYSHYRQSSSIELQLDDMGLLFSWAPDKLHESLQHSISPLSPMKPRSCSTECLREISALVEEGNNLPEAKIRLSSGVSAFLFLYLSIIGFKPGKLVVTSQLPLGSGLGSSASFCVSITAALLAVSNCVHKIDFGSDSFWFSLTERELELVNKWAFEGEKIIHGKPSGIDNTVSTYGNMIMFKPGELTLLKPRFSVGMLVTNTKVGRSTKALVASVSERTLRHPDAMAAVVSAVDSISKELAEIIRSSTSDDISVTTKEEKLEELMQMNQGLLQCMGVSHSSIETVLQTTLKYKLASKLTGAGGGGCVLTLLPKILSSNVVDKVILELEAYGFECFKAEVGGNGLEVCCIHSQS